MSLRATLAAPFVRSHRRRSVASRAVLALSCWLVSSASSISLAQTATPSAPSLPPIGVSTGAFVQGLLGLVVIIALLLVTLAALKRWGGQFGGVSTTGMKVISGLSVGARERILLIEVGDTWLVVGVTASQIRTLHTLPKDSLPDVAGQENKPAFAHWLSTVMERKRHEA